MKKQELKVFTLFLTLSLVLRFPSFFESIIDWDESLYILMGRSLANGHLPYIEVWDHKPVGMSVLFALAFILLGNSIFSIRLLSCIAVAVTCYFLYRLGRIVGNNNEIVGLFSGIIYAILSLTNNGLAAKPEIFYLPFVTIGFYLLLSTKSYPEQLLKFNSLRLFLAGLSMGFALQVKQVVIFDFIAVLLIATINIYQESTSKRFLFVLQKIFRCYILLITGLVLPFLLALFYYSLNGYFNEYIYANFTANVIRSTDALSLNNLAKALLVQPIQYFLLWSCLGLTIYSLLFSKAIEPQAKKNLYFLLIWFLMSCVGVIYTKNFWSPYFLQLLPSLCLVSACTASRIVYQEKGRQTTRHRLALATLFIGLLISFYFAFRAVKKSTEIIYYHYIKGIKYWGDPPGEVADYLRTKVPEGAYIYVVDYEPIIYFLVRAKVPTKYVFPPHMFDGHLAKVAGVNPFQEVKSIIQKKPLYIIKREASIPDARQAVYTGLELYLKGVIETTIDKLTRQIPVKTEPIPQHSDALYTEIEQYLKKYYVFETKINGVKLYKLKTQNPS